MKRKTTKLFVSAMMMAFVATTTLSPITAYADYATAEPVTADPVTTDPVAENGDVGAGSASETLEITKVTESSIQLIADEGYAYGIINHDDVSNEKITWAKSKDYSYATGIKTVTFSGLDADTLYSIYRVPEGLIDPNQSSNPEDVEDQAYIEPVYTDEADSSTNVSVVIETDTIKDQETETQAYGTESATNKETESTTNKETETKSSADKETTIESSTESEDDAESSTKSEDGEESTTKSEDNTEPTTENEDDAEPTTKSEDDAEPSTESEDDAEPSTKSEDGEESTTKSEDDVESTTKAESETESETDKKTESQTQKETKASERNPYIYAFAGSYVTGLANEQRYAVGTTATIRAVGNGMDNINPVNGDTRWRPYSWDWANGQIYTDWDSDYTVSFSLKQAGDYKLNVSFERDDYVNGKWVASGVLENYTIHFTVVQDIPADVFHITAISGANGSITPNGTISVNAGDSKTFTFTPNNGFVVARVFVDGKEVTNQIRNNSYTFSNVRGNHSISVAFEQPNRLTTPRTGDSMNIPLIVGLMAASLIIIVAVIVLMRRKKS